MVTVACNTACGGERDGSAMGTPSESPYVEGWTSVEPIDPAASGLFGCGEVPTSADDSVRVGVSLPADLVAEAPFVTVKAMTGAAPAAVNGKTRVQGVDAAERVVTSSNSSTADFPVPIAPVPRDLPADSMADRALLPCPGTDESDVAGYIGIVSEEDGGRLWVSDPEPPPPSLKRGSSSPAPPTDTSTN